jgi:hypothetical protein
MNSLVKYFHCGRVEIASERLHVNFVVPRRNLLTLKVKLFLFSRNIHFTFIQDGYLSWKKEGVKRLDFEDFCKVAELMKDKLHLTNEGLEQIRKIKLCNNANRKLA